MRKSIVITGASSGIGRATALRLAKNGWRVFAAVRKESDALAIREQGGEAIQTVTLDVTDRESIGNAARAVTAQLAGGGLDALFNNAGIGSLSPVEFTSFENLRKIFEVNLFGQIATIQAFLPLIRAAKGRIVNTGSVGDHLTPPFGGPLASSKAAFASMTSALRLELRPQGIEVCLIEPGAINTPAVKKTLGDVEGIIGKLPPDGASLYGDTMRQVARAFMKKELAGSPPETVAEVVERALTDRHPRTRYAAGKDSIKLTLLARVLPEKLMDMALLRAFGATR